MFFQLLFIHLFRPFLKYTQATSPLPNTVSPRKLCTQAAAMISKLMRLYKRSHGLRQICNIAIYITHSACTIHLLNLPDKHARRDIVHGVKHLEEIAEGWLGARRTLTILSMLARKWGVELPDDAAVVLARTDTKYGAFQGDAQSPSSQRRESVPMMNPPQLMMRPSQAPATVPVESNSTATHRRPSAAPSTTAASGSNAAMRPDTGSHQPYPQELPALPAHQYQAATVAVPATPQYRTWSNQNRRQDGNSPSEMFGGVEQLIRDSQDWVYRDQAQLATGFENWNNEIPQWNASTAMSIPVNPTSSGAHIRSAPRSSVQSMSPQSNGGYVAAVAANGGNASVEAMANWLNSMNAYNSMAASYDENEWYQ